MLLTKETTIYTLTQEYPSLIEALAAHNPAFEKLKNTILRQTMGRIATIEKAAAMGNERVLDLLLFIAGTIMATTGTTVEIVPPDSQNQDARTGGLSREERLTALKEIIRELHEGAEFAHLQEKFAQTVGDITPDEIASLEQTLVQEGLPETEIKKMCHLHAALFKEALDGQETPAMPSGHPVHTFMEENRQAKEVLAELHAELKKIGEKPGETVWSFVVGQLRFLVQELAGIHVHYVRKENQLFPLLEQHGLSAPGKVMWEVHDDIRRQLRCTQELLTDKNRNAARKALSELLDAIDDMIEKEDRILFPMTLKVLSEKDWHRCRLGEEEIGFAFDVVPGNEWTAESTETVVSKPTTGLIDLATGQLPSEVINAILCNLPVDISFVDADDKVAYYSDSAHRIFPRSPGVIGRDVKNCHPPKSLHMVAEILEAFKKGERKRAEFWLELGGKFIHIQYLALHNQQGEYLGCLEVGHDATHVRSLQGQRRLLEWN
ncbi:DUF438 domain-containing protein [Desulfobulbus rhabdoformis]|uniref:DUF438 domain-containing protein n=1 Tax=Desulfobulbus rhabdoformis TaxID=34032 RepID=UPI0019627F28|nr:DUF438 domain-containing protein [Desulfobulbus rhabdoformis]MBM9612878.1 DUF438 domain-containing protein [Desulfobulbus rhabdoformis]